MNTKLNTNLSLFDVIFGSVDNPAFNFFISLVSFCICKEWLHYYKNTKDWKNNDILIFVKRNVTLHFDTYKHCKNIVNSKLEFLEHFYRDTPLCTIILQINKTEIKI